MIERLQNDYRADTIETNGANIYWGKWIYKNSSIKIWAKKLKKMWYGHVFKDGKIWGLNGFTWLKLLFFDEKDVGEGDPVKKNRKIEKIFFTILGPPAWGTLPPK